MCRVTFTNKLHFISSSRLHKQPNQLLMFNNIIYNLSLTSKAISKTQ